MEEDNPHMYPHTCEHANMHSRHTSTKDAPTKEIPKLIVDDDCSFTRL